MIDILLQVFSTSPSPDSCTMGVWAAYDPRLQLIILDTEGSISSLKDIVQPLLTSIRFHNCMHLVYKRINYDLRHAWKCWRD